MRAIERVVQALEANGCNPRRNSSGYSFKCPAHDNTFNVYWTPASFDESYPNNTWNTSRSDLGATNKVVVSGVTSKRGFVAIYNPSGANNVTVDISAIGLTSGDQYRVSSIQDVFTDRITNTYTVASVSFPMTNHTVCDLYVNTAYPSNRPPVFYPELGGFLIEYLGAGVSGRTNFSVFGGKASLGGHWRR